MLDQCGHQRPGVVLAALKKLQGASFDDVAETVKELLLRSPASSTGGPRGLETVGRPFGIVDLSLAPTPAMGDSVAKIIEEMDWKAAAHRDNRRRCLLNDAVKKGGVMAHPCGGLSGAFIRSARTRDDRAVQRVPWLGETGGHDECVLSGLDMIAVPGYTRRNPLGHHR